MMTKGKNSQFVQIIFVAGLILAAVVVYFPPYARAWVGDDYVQLGYVLEFVAEPLTAVRLFNPFTLTWYYRPLQNVWFLVNRLVFGLEPFAFYWQLLLLHALATALVYRVTRQWGVRPFAAVAATTLFAIHAHFVDVVAWVSSVAIVMTAVFSMLSLSFFLEYCQGTRAREGGRDARAPRGRLWLTALFFLLALLSHEEAVLLPPFLLLVALFNRQSSIVNRQLSPGKRQSPSLISNFQSLLADRGLVVALGGMLAVTAVVVIIQLTRPNLTIDLTETPGGRWLGLAAPGQIARFVSDVALAYTLQFQQEAAVMGRAGLFGLGVTLLFGIWFWLGTQAARLGLAWVALHLALIYVTLWSQKPELFAGRHFYNAAIGLAWAMGATIDQARAAWPAGFRLGRRRVSWVAAGVVVGVTAVLLGHLSVLQNTQAGWLARAERDARAEREMKAILPAIGPETHVFANRFPITPQFFRAVTQVWYNLPAKLPPPVGAFDQLQKYGRATADFYLFDYEDGQLYNLMPELQISDETIFLWRDEPDVVGAAQANFAIVGPPGLRRLAIQVKPLAEAEGWLGLVYEGPTTPANSTLRLAFRSDAASETPFRVRLAGSGPETVYEGVFRPGEEWVEVMIPLDSQVGERLTVWLETAVAPPSSGYWANPRLTVATEE
jgi:hypothetical protein